MDEYIKRDDAYSAIRSNMFDKMRTFPKRRQRLNALLLDLINIIGIIPASDVRENVHARWKCTAIGNYACSYCCREPYYSGNIEDYKYCPYCGADMKGESDQ